MTHRNFNKVINRYMKSLRRWQVEFDRVGKGGKFELRRWSAHLVEIAKVRALPKYK